MALRHAQPTLFPELDIDPPVHPTASSTFINNMRLPVHRWIRFSAGFSGAWAHHVIATASKRGVVRVFDPFAGSGTTLIAAEDAGVPCFGVEAHPFVSKIARAKLARRASRDTFRAVADKILRLARDLPASIDHYPKLIRTCYSDDVLAQLDRVRRALALIDDRSDIARLAWLSLVAILRACSHAGTAPWQYVLPRKSKRFPAEPYSAFQSQCRMMLADMDGAPGDESGQAALVSGDARNCPDVPDGFATLVITSPPYPNNYDYADATRLEMCFMGEINGWSDLQGAVRRYLVRSCTQHVPQRSVELAAVLSDPVLEPIRREMTPLCEELAKVRLSRGGKKTYHLMVACYFHDLAQVWVQLRRVCDSPSDICFVVGDSAPYGVYVPVMKWLGELAMAAGFKSYCFERTRDRNVKWKNRKHRVPLCEGRLWVEG